MTHPSTAAAVVIPTCNRREILERALTELARQTHPNFEVIVVDDRSTDGTEEMVRRVDRAFPEFNIRYLRNDEQLGANASRNKGVRATNAPLVAFLDSDAIPEQNWLSELLDPFTDPRVGATTGLVQDADPKNIYDRTFRGTHRVPAGDALRLAGTNMAARRDLLLKHSLDEDRAAPDTSQDGAPDTAVSGRGDEEGLYLILKAMGRRIVCTHTARVLHIHHYTRRSFYKQALRGGRSAARLVYKFRLPPRKDMLPFVLAYASLPLILIDLRLAAIPAGFLLIALAAITWNDLSRKAKSPADVFRTFHVLLAYYHVRLIGYASETLRLALTGKTCEGTTLERTDLTKPRRNRTG